MPRRQQLEQTCHRAVFEHTQWRGRAGLFVFHCPNGGWRSLIEARIFKSLGVVAGIPDILCIFEGRVYALELKAGRGRLTPVQIETQQRMREAGVTVATVVGVDAALRQLEHWRLLRGTMS